MMVIIDLAFIIIRLSAFINASCLSLAIGDLMNPLDILLNPAALKDFFPSVFS